MSTFSDCPSLLQAHFFPLSFLRLTAGIFCFQLTLLKQESRLIAASKSECPQERGTLSFFYYTGNTCLLDSFNVGYGLMELARLAMPGLNLFTSDHMTFEMTGPD